MDRRTVLEMIVSFFSFLLPKAKASESISGYRWLGHATCSIGPITLVTNPNPVWTHDYEKGDVGVCVFDANGAELHGCLRCNIHTGTYEIRRYSHYKGGVLIDTTTMSNSEWRTRDFVEEPVICRMRALPPLSVVPTNQIDWKTNEH
jgi:hypothetical protein